MKPLKPYQQAPSWSGPASLKILLSHYGKDVTEGELAGHCGTSPGVDASHDGIAQAVKAIGAIPSAKTAATMDDLRVHVENDIPVLIGLTDREMDHYSVVYEVGKAKVYLMDPKTQSGIRILPIEEFETAWHDHGAPGGAPTERWMLTVAGI